MARYSDLVNDVRSAMPEAPDKSINEYVRRAVVEFCKSSRVWRESVSIPLESGQSNYRIRIRDGRADQILHALYVNDRGVRQVLRHLPHGHVTVPGRSPQPGSPRYFSFSPSGLTLFPEVGGTELENAPNPRIELYAVAVPNRNSRSFPDFINERWYEGLVSGAIFMLARLPGKPWTSGDLMAIHRPEYQRAITNARQSVDGWAPGHSRPPRWV